MKLSIITINFNNLQGLQKTMESVFAQTFTNYEYIVIDGGSTDGSQALIEEYSNQLFFWVSETDNGIYHAMNKGAAKANGEYLLFLNSGDYLSSHNVVGSLFEQANGEDIVYGDLLFEKNNSFTECRFPNDLKFSFFIDGFNSLPHAATLIKKAIFEKIGPYTEKFEIVSDWEFFLLAINKYNCTYLHVPVITTVFNLNGISAKESNIKKIKQERTLVLEKHFPTFLEDYELLNKKGRELSEIKSTLWYKAFKKIT